jgi:hypothetical protein
MTTKRECGSCSLCCKVMGVPEVKEDFKWCPHCAPGHKAGGCQIYENRPERCRDFHCQWLIDQRFGDYWFPKKAKILVDHKLDGETAYVYFVVDHDYPNRWREEPYFSDIKKIARAGLAGSLGKKWVTLVLVRDVRIIVGR